MKHAKANIIAELGPFPGVSDIAGVTYDGTRVWIAAGDRLEGIDPDGNAALRTIDVPAHAGTAFDGTHLYQMADGQIRKIDTDSGAVLATIPSPGGGADSGLAWAEGSLWVGQYRDRKIIEIDPETGKVLRTIGSDRFVTGVCWVEGELWHATMEDGASELRHIEADGGEVLETVEMPKGVTVSGLESDGAGRFFCGGGSSGKLRVVQKPPRAS